MSDKFPLMQKPAEFYRVKVRVDGGWVSAGDFRDLSQAKSRARLMSWHLEREVEVRNHVGQLIHSEGLVLMVGGTKTVSFGESAGKTVSLD